MNGLDGKKKQLWMHSNPEWTSTCEVRQPTVTRWFVNSGYFAAWHMILKLLKQDLTALKHRGFVCFFVVFKTKYNSGVRKGFEFSSWIFATSPRSAQKNNVDIVRSVCLLLCHTTISSSIERQRDLTTSHCYIQLDPFASELTSWELNGFNQQSFRYTLIPLCLWVVNVYHARICHC
jgi:hypothetical protein